MANCLLRAERTDVKESVLTKQAEIDLGSVKRKLKQVSSKPKGRRVDAAALTEVQAALGGEALRRDLLIEHLHKIQDRYRYISAAHIVALAQEMKLAMTEVYEVATFYHHFDVVKEGDPPPPAVTVRVCDSLSCEIAGAQALLHELRTILGAQVRVIPAPCVGRCETAPVVVVGQNWVAFATSERVRAAVETAATHSSTQSAAHSMTRAALTRAVSPRACN